MTVEFQYFAFYKPYDVLTQFTKEHPDHKTLSDYLKVNNDVYPVGRLDKDSEGLLLLTNDKKVNAALLHPERKLEKTYFVQVDGEINKTAIEILAGGVDILLNDKIYHTRPCKVKKLSSSPDIPDRNPPIRTRLHIPTSWIMVTLEEGKNRQIRKMCAKVGFPVLRLIRVQMGNLKLLNLLPGQSRKISKEEWLTLFPMTAPKMTASPKTKFAKTPAKKDGRTSKLKSFTPGSRNHKK